MNRERKLTLIYLILGSIGFSTLLITDAYGQFESGSDTQQGADHCCTPLTQLPDFHQGIGLDPTNRNTISHLNYIIQYDDGIETGSTQRAFADLVIDTSLSFTDQNNPVRTINHIEVYGETDHLNIGTPYCFQEPNWNFEQTIIRNGEVFDAPKQFTQREADFDSSTQRSTSKGIQFTPTLIERLFNLQGITLVNGDEITWRIIADNRATIVEGRVSSELIREGETLFIDSQFGLCTVDPSGQGYDAFATGMVFEMNMIWVDPKIDLLGEQIESDLDGDGIPDDRDLCTFQAENYNGFEDNDGCADVIPIPPEVQSQVMMEIEQLEITQDEDVVVIINEDNEIEVIVNLDSDNDGIPNDIDECPNDAEIFNGIEDDDGCPFETLTPQVKFISTNPQTNIHTSPTEPPVQTLEGQTEECNALIENCNEVVAQAIQDFEETVGIKLPFEPSILNIMLLFGVIGVIVIVIAGLTGKLKKL